MDDQKSQSTSPADLPASSISVEQAKDVSEAKKPFKQMSYEEQRKDLARRALTGKCPIRFFKDADDKYTEKIDWKYPLVKESYESWDDVLKHLTATTDYHIAMEIFNRGRSALPGNDNSVERANIAVQTLADAAPQDATEAKLCMQEMALYAQGMRHLSIAENCNMIPQAEFHTKTAVKLLRLHNETIEARSKYRRGGEQRVVVQHVNVNDGGQAVIVGSKGEGGNKKMEEPHGV